MVILKDENLPPCKWTMGRILEIVKGSDGKVRVVNVKTRQDKRKLQRILSRENRDEPIKTFELSTVTYGTTSAPFLATRTLKQLALDEAEHFPLGSSVVMSEMYIDDVLTSADTLLETKELKNQLISIFHNGEIVDKEWRQFVESLHIINKINIERCVVVEQLEVIKLQGFSDASQLAFGAVVVYCKSVTAAGRMLVHLSASKSQVSSIKQTRIPRLELWAAVLLAKLVHRVKQALKIKVTNTFLWSESMIVLSWIKRMSYQLKTFVDNRIASIQEMTTIEEWSYVPTENNLADFVSRGMDPTKLKTCELWWNGPTFLMSNQYPQREIPVAVIKDPVSYHHDYVLCKSCMFKNIARMGGMFSVRV
ncbi:integrase catalytic domain-containing protein [Trichonephila clavipes]|uniref:Integrase catalytic domain-containing protein n=1 Tax=Trichonephila clavipes TaxID=2585209 RepID=A0A8X6R516_TRICX|nr:integrase catalytic domain-containing protein [Trichonephila clavipes]